MEWAIGAQQDAAIFHPVDEFGGFRPVAHFEAEEQAEAADVRNQRLTGLQVAQAGDQVFARRSRVLLESFVVDHVQHGDTDRARDRIAAERVEVLHAVSE